MTKEIVYINAMDKIYTLIEAGAYSNAIKIMKKRGRLSGVYSYDVNHSWYIIGDAYFKMKNYHMAIKAFKRACKVYPEDWAALMAIGNSYSELGRPKLAEKIFRKALLIEPENMALWFNLANALFDQKKFNLALVEYSKIARTECSLSSRVNNMINMICKHDKKSVDDMPNG